MQNHLKENMQQHLLRLAVSLKECIEENNLLKQELRKHKHERDVEFQKESLSMTKRLRKVELILEQHIGDLDIEQDELYIDLQSWEARNTDYLVQTFFD